MSASNQFGKYEIVEEIGRGGFAVVYRARDTTLDRIVALKVLAPHLTWDPRFVERFHREAKAVARLRHPNIVVVHEMGEQAGQVYIAMEYLDGRTLAQVIADEGALPLDRATAILGQVADALDYAHEQGVLHRDVKPANIMVKEGGRVRLLTTLMDFGLVKAMESNESLTSMGTVLGSPEYMAPEQADSRRNDEIGPTTDRYALGVVAYHALTGRVPFSGPTTAVLHAHAYESPPDPQGIRESLSAGVAQVLLKALSKETESRYTSATEMVDALRGAAEAKAPIRPQSLTPQSRAAQGFPVGHVTPQPAAEAVIKKKEEPVAQRKPGTAAGSFGASILQIGSWQKILQEIQTPLWRRWVLAGLAGATATQTVTVIMLALARLDLHHGIGWAVGQFDYSCLFWPIGAMSGVAFGMAQETILRKRITEARGWSLATMLGSFVGWIAGTYTVRGLRIALNYPEGMFAWAAMWAIFGAVFHGSAGMAQWIVLRLKVGSSRHWVRASGLAAVLGGIAGGILAWTIFALGGADTANAPLCLAAGAVGSVAARTITEAIVGLTLAQLVRTEEQMGS